MHVNEALGTERCLHDDCLAYLMAKECRKEACNGFEGYCSFESLCPFSKEERARLTAPGHSLIGLTETWRSAIVENASRRFEAAYEEGRREAEERWKAKEEKWQTSE